MYVVKGLLIQIRIADRPHAVGIVVAHDLHHGRDCKQMKDRCSKARPVVRDGSADGNKGNRPLLQSFLRKCIRVARQLARSSLVQYPVDGGNIVPAGKTVHEILELSRRRQGIYRSRDDKRIRPADLILQRLEIILENADIVLSLLKLGRTCSAAPAASDVHVHRIDKTDLSLRVSLPAAKKGFLAHYVTVRILSAK